VKPRKETATTEGDDAKLRPEEAPVPRVERKSVGPQTARRDAKASINATSMLPANYAELLRELKGRVHSAQAKAATAVNRELIALYLHIGRRLAEQDEHAGWGEKMVERLAKDLRAAFPEMSGFSRTNLFYMRQVYQAWIGAGETVQQLVGQIPWGHHLVLLTKVKEPNARLWYLERAVTHRWSRAVLTVQVESRLHERQGKALTNFRRTLSSMEADMAQQTLKDPYIFDFLALGSEVQEREVENALVDHVQRFLLELGVGFSFVGRQMHIHVGDEDFYIDLLFYHLKLRCFVVIELKAVPFKPEFAGKINFYLSAVDAQMRHPDDRPSIGLLLCKSKDRVVVEYALRDLRKPIGVAAWETQLVESLPEELRGVLPTIEELEAELG
jgi:predicted nuclease of restriction endonuclease-like (RecB) superfamily